MATFILKWNPAISSFTMEDCKRLCGLFPFGKLNWSVWEHERCKRSKPYKEAYVMESNGLTIICGEIEFEKVTQYDKEFIPVTI